MTDQRPYLAGRRLDRDHRAGTAGEQIDGSLLGIPVDVGEDVMSGLFLAPELVEDRGELGILPDQLPVVGLLELGVALLGEAVADRVAIEAAQGVPADELGRRALPGADRAGDHRAVIGEDAAALDLLRGEQRPLVDPLVLEIVGIENRPVRREPDQHREQDGDEREQLDDPGVHQ